jgi:HAMP domain-containing protein
MVNTQPIPRQIISRQRLGFRSKITLVAVLPVTIIGILIVALFLLYRPSILGVVSQNLASTVTRVLATSLDVTDFSLVESQLRAAVSSRDVAFVDVRPPNATMRFFVSKTPDTDWYLSRQYDAYLRDHSDATRFEYTDRLAETYRDVRAHINQKIDAFRANNQRTTVFEVIRAEVYDLPNGQRELRFATEPRPKGVKVFDLGVGVLAKDVQGVLDTQFRLILSISLAAIALALVVAITVSQRLARPILQITSAANRISLGEIHTPITTLTRNEAAQDEVEDLGRAVERLRLSLVLAMKRSKVR